MNLSDNFTFEEMTFSETAVRYGIRNLPTPEQMKNLQILCEKCLQPIRNTFGPIKITSGFRNYTLNKLVGGSKNSQHTKGQAADFIIPGHDIKAVFEAIKSAFEYDQLILEFNSWIHISYSDENRKESLIARRIKGRVRYERV